MLDAATISCNGEGIPTMPPSSKSESEILRAHATIAVLRELASKDRVTLPNRYRLLPSADTISYPEACALIARLPKPVVCISAIEDDVVNLDCREFETALSLSQRGMKNWGVVRDRIEHELRRRLEGLVTAPIETWVVKIVAGNESVSFGFSDYLKWIREYAFRNGVVKQGPAIPLDTASPELIVTVAIRRNDPPDVVFVTPPQESEG